MKLIVGLGNPGRKYEQTRHNVGFMVASQVAGLIGAGPVKAKFSGEITEGVWSGSQTTGQKIVVLCPHTYMNASGKSVRKACDFFKLSTEDLLVVCDDLNLATGRLRIRANGSAGGQKGLADIIRHLGTETFPRLRIGIDRPPQQWGVSDYVLGKFSDEEKVKIEGSIAKASQAALDWASEGIGAAMNRYNVNPNPKPKPPKPKKKPQDKPKQESNNKSDADSSPAKPNPIDSENPAQPEPQRLQDQPENHSDRPGEPSHDPGQSPSQP